MLILHIFWIVSSIKCRCILLRQSAACFEPKTFRSCVQTLTTKPHHHPNSIAHNHCSILHLSNTLFSLSFCFCPSAHTHVLSPSSVSLSLLSWQHFWSLCTHSLFTAAWSCYECRNNDGGSRVLESLWKTMQRCICCVCVCVKFVARQTEWKEGKR